MNRLFPVVFILTIVCSCGKKKRNRADEPKFFPVVAFLNTEFKKLDSAGSDFILVRSLNGNTDTTSLSKAELKQYEKEFLAIPDLTDDETGEGYSQSSTYDTLLGKIVMTYTADDEDAELVRQHVTLSPKLQGSDQVDMIYLEKFREAGDSTVEKKLLWEGGRSFSIRTIVQKENSPAKVENVKVAWKKTEPAN